MFKNARAIRHYGDHLYSYLIVYDYMAGLRNRYTTYMISRDPLERPEAIVIGRELTLGHSKRVVKMHINANEKYGI